MDRVKDDTDRDNFMSADEAVEYGIIDEVLESRKISASA
jgi:ATP-dependent Clp protease protease subunit